MKLTYVLSNGRQVYKHEIPARAYNERVPRIPAIGSKFTIPRRANRIYRILKARNLTAYDIEYTVVPEDRFDQFKGPGRSVEQRYIELSRYE